MGKIQILTQKQKLILESVRRNRFLRKQFYFTGGTVLAQYYLKHRFSDDLDFFSEEKFDNRVILALIDDWSKLYKFSFTSRFAEVVYRFDLHFPDNSKFIVDFGYYPYPRVEKGSVDDDLRIDSLRDIATNKLFTINQRTEVKDFVDLYFLLKNKFTVWDLIYSLEAKFKNFDLDVELLAMDMLKAEDFKILPIIIKPLKLEELRKFFRDLAKSLGRRAVK